MSRLGESSLEPYVKNPHLQVTSTMSSNRKRSFCYMRTVPSENLVVALDLNSLGVVNFKSKDKLPVCFLFVSNTSLEWTYNCARKLFDTLSHILGQCYSHPANKLLWSSYIQSIRLFTIEQAVIRAIGRLRIQELTWSRRITALRTRHLFVTLLRDEVRPAAASKQYYLRGQ
jgi:hypothetical protein